MGRDSRGDPEYWLDAMLTEIESLTVFPKRCPLAPESFAVPCEIRQLLAFGYRILFVVEDQIVNVLRVRHGARLPLPRSVFGPIQDEDGE